MKFNLNLDSINYIKIVYQDENSSTRCTKAAIKRMGEREIFACAKFEDGLNIKTPQDILLSFICDNGLYRTTTPLKFIESEPPYVFFTIKTPDGLEYQQNREYFRVRMIEDAILSFELNNEKITVPCKTHDISAKGVRVVLSEEIATPQNAYINVLFPKRDIKTKTRFIRFDNEDNILMAAFEFVNLSDNDTDMISQLCIQKQLEYKRKNIM